MKDIEYHFQKEILVGPCRIQSDLTGIYLEHTGIVSFRYNFFFLLLFQTPVHSWDSSPKDIHQNDRCNSIRRVILSKLMIHLGLSIKCISSIFTIFVLIECFLCFIYIYTNLQIVQ